MMDHHNLLIQLERLRSESYMFRMQWDRAEREIAELKKRLEQKEMEKQIAMVSLKETRKANERLISEKRFELTHTKLQHNADMKKLEVQLKEQKELLAKAQSSEEEVKLLGLQLSVTRKNLHDMTSKVEEKEAVLKALQSSIRAQIEAEGEPKAEETGSSAVELVTVILNGMTSLLQDLRKSREANEAGSFACSSSRGAEAMPAAEADKSQDPPIGD